jgi:phosphatidylglycerophosphatase C
VAAAPGPGAAAALALFDLDGTITRRDTLLPYVLGFLRSHPARAAGLARLLPVLVRFGLRTADRGELKAALITATLGGFTRTEIDAWTARFVPRLVARGLWRDALACIARHRTRGDRLVLMSASVDLYVPAIARALGFHDTLCTPIRWNGERLDGALAGANLRGAQKARALKQLRDVHPGVTVTAYGNAASDLGHLCLADRGVLVNGGPRTRRAAQHLGLTCVSWR